MLNQWCLLTISNHNLFKLWGKKRVQWDSQKCQSKHLFYGCLLCMDFVKYPNPRRIFPLTIMTIYCLKKKENLSEK